MANPALGLDIARLRSLLFEIIGENRIMHLRLPNDPQFSHLRHGRTLLLRLKWTLEALYIAHRQPTLVPLPVSFGGDPEALRVVLFLLETCSFEGINDRTLADYLTWRYLALDVITTAIAILLLSEYEVGLDEEDVIINGLRKVRNVWKNTFKLSPTEQALLEDIIPDSLTLPLHDALRLRNTTPETEVEDFITTITSTAKISLENFWQLHDVISECISALGPATSGGLNATTEPATALNIIGVAYENTKREGMSAESAALIQFQIERLSLAAGSVTPQWPEQTLVLDMHVAKRLRRVFKDEVEDFRRFAAVPKDDVVRRWVEDESSMRSPLTARSDENHAPSSFTSHGTPMESRNSLASTSKTLDTTLSVDPLRFRQRESRGSSNISQELKGRHSDSDEIFADVKPDLRFSAAPSLERRISPPPPIQRDRQGSVTGFGVPIDPVVQGPPSSSRVSIPRKPLPQSLDSAIGPSPVATGDSGIPYVSAWDSPVSTYQSLEASSSTHSSYSTSFSQQPAGSHPQLPLDSSSYTNANLASNEDMSSPSHTSFASRGYSLREAGRQLPVSTFTPPSKIPEVPEQAHYEESLQDTIGSAIESENIHSQTNAQPGHHPMRRMLTGIGGLELSNVSLPLQSSPPIIQTQSSPTVDRISEKPELDSSRSAADIADSPSNNRQARSPSLASAAETHSIQKISAGSVASRKKSSLFSMFTRSTKPSVSNSLPQSLDFRFSPCGKHLMLWCKKEPQDIVRIDYPFRSGKCFQFAIPPSVRLPRGKLPSRSIRHLVCSGDDVFAVAYVENSRWIYYLEADALRPLVQLDENIPPVLALAVSPDGTLVGFGCGECTYVYKVIDAEIEQKWRLSQREDVASQVVRVQKLNFSIDSRRLVSCVQVEQGLRPTAYVSTWAFQGSRVELQAQLNPISLTIGYAGDTGIASVHIVEQSSLNVSQIFLTAGLSKSYPSILHLSTGAKNKHLDLPDIRITSTSQCQAPSSSHIFAVVSGRNKVFRVDTRTCTTELVASFAAERKNVHHQHDFIALSMPGPDQIYAMWRAADEKLVVKICTSVRNNWTITSLTVHEVYCPLVDSVY